MHEAELGTGATLTVGVNTSVTSTSVDQHSVVHSATLHVVPGAIIFASYIIAAPYAIALGYPAELALMLSFLLVGMPLQLAYLSYQARKRNGTLSLRGIVLYLNPLPLWQYVVLFVVLFAVALCALILTSPINAFLAARVFSWLPVYLLPGGESLLPWPAQTAVLATLVLTLVVDGIMNPIVEELYFRGYLLPRLSRLRWFSPVINASLFTLAHFWQPFNYPLIFLIQLPLVCIVYWKRNIYIAMLTHCVGNVIGATMALV